MISFQEFLRQKAAESGWNGRIDGRAEWLKAIGWLFARIRALLQDADPNGILEIVEYEVERVEKRSSFRWLARDRDGSRGGSPWLRSSEHWRTLANLSPQLPQSPSTNQNVPFGRTECPLWPAPGTSKSIRQSTPF